MPREKLLWENLGLTKSECLRIQNFVFPIAASARKTAPSSDLLVIHAHYKDHRPEFLIFAIFMYGQIFGIAKGVESSGRKVTLNPNNAEYAIEVGYIFD